MEKKYKIIVDTDGDIGEYSTTPYLKKSGFEMLSSDSLNKNELAPLLLSIILMVRFLPKYYDRYHIKDILNVVKKMYDEKNKIIKIPTEDEFNKMVEEHDVLKKIFKDNDNLYQIITEFIKDVNYFIKSDSDEEVFYSGNQTVSVVRVDKKMNEFEKAIVDVIREEFGITYKECERIAKRIIERIGYDQI